MSKGISAVKVGELLAKQLKLEKQLLAKGAQLKVAQEFMNFIKDFSCAHEQGWLDDIPMSILLEQLFNKATEGLKHMDEASGL